MVVRAADPASAATKRVDRPALAKFLASVKESGVPSLEALSQYAAKNPPLMESPVVLPHVMLVAPNAISIGMRGLQDWKMLRVYGLLSQSDKAGLRQGSAIPFGNLNAKAKGIVTQMVFGAGAKLQVGPEKEGMPGLFMGMGMNRMSQPKTYKEEPTELMPNGLPAAGLLKLDLKPSHFVINTGAQGGMSMLFGAMGPEEYAMLKYFQDEPQMAQVTSMMPKLDKLKVGERDILDFRFILAEDVSQKHTLLDQRISKDAAIIGPDGLPKSFLAEVDKQIKLYKEGLSPFMSMPGMMGGAGVPPR